MLTIKQTLIMSVLYNTYTKQDNNSVTSTELPKLIMYKTQKRSATVHNWLFQIKNALPHRGCQKSLQNGNPDCKILSMCGNPDDFCKIYLEVVEIVTKTWNLVKFYQKYLEMWSKTVTMFWNSSP